MDTQTALKIGSKRIQELTGHVFDVLTISKPISPESAVNLSKVISKLSPLLGNMIEFHMVDILNTITHYKDWGKWIRQDPGFPDTIFKGKLVPTPGFEIKAWFPIATEITARFKDSQNHFAHDQSYVAMLAWIPEFLIYGKPYVLDVCVVSGRSVAESRDKHYHNPPDYLVREPEDTSARTGNLQQTNTNGYKFQGTKNEFKEAERVVRDWGPEGRLYKPTREYQLLMRQLTHRFPYRLDTNYAKMDRIEHPEIEDFKTRVLKTAVRGMSIQDWSRTLFSADEDVVKGILKDNLGIKTQPAEKLLE